MTGYSGIRVDDAFDAASPMAGFRIEHCGCGDNQVVGADLCCKLQKGDPIQVLVELSMVL